MSRTIVAIALGCLLFGCSNKKDDPGQPAPPVTPTPPVQPDLSKVDLSVTAETYSREWAADRNAAVAKYKGKVVEITGKVWLASVNIQEKLWRVGLYADGKPEAGRALIASLSEPEPGKENELRLLSRGQQVKIRAIGGSSVGDGELLNAKLAEIGPTTAKVATVSEVVQELNGKDPMHKYADVDVLIRVKILEQATGSSFTWVVADPDVPNGPRVSLQESHSRVWRKEFEALKSGDVVTLLGVPAVYATHPSIDCPRIVNEAPVGLTLPSKK